MSVDKAFYRNMLQIAIPIALQNLIASSLNTMDTIMVSQLGAASIASVGLSNQLFFIFVFLTFGINTGSSVFMAQYWGRKDTKSLRHIFGLVLSFSVILAVIFSLLAIVTPEWILSLMIQDPEVIQIGAGYLRVVGFSYLVTALSFTLETALRTCGDPKTPLIASFISFGTQLFFNYAFIFGEFGFPRLGVVGAAVGTIIARLAEFIYMFYTIKTNDGPFNTSIRNLLNFDKVFLRHYLRFTWPVLLNEAFWSVGQVLYNVAYATVGTNAIAAVQVSFAIQQIVFVIVRGLGSSCTIILGRTIGEGALDRVNIYAKRYLKLALITGIVIGGFLIVSPNITLMIFGNLSPVVYSLAVKILKVLGVVFIVKTINSIIIIGILRGGGDTLFAMILESLCVWGVGVPLAFIGAVFLKLPIYWVVALAGTEEIFKILLGLKRIASEKWVHIL